MKLSAWHKQQCDSVEWYIPIEHSFPFPPMDKVYMSKVFSFTSDYEYFVNADEFIEDVAIALYIEDGEKRNE